MKSDLLRAERIKRGWTQAKVAEAVGVDARTVGRWERGNALPYPYYREQLCLLFDKTPQQLGWLSVDEDQLLENVTFLDVQSTRSDISVSASLLVDPSIPYALESATDLVGRDSLLTKVKEHLLTEENVSLMTLDGLLGVGKTAIVTVLAMDQQVREHFCDGILWAGLGPSPNILGHLTRWGMLLGVVPNQVENINSREAWGQALQAAIGTRRLLLILDDVWTAEDVLSLQVGGMACAHVVTTRFSEVACALDQRASITVAELDEMESITLLSHFVPGLVKQYPRDACALVQAVGGLPLALTLMSSYLASQPFPIQSHSLQVTLALLHDTKERLRMKMPKLPAEGAVSLGKTIPLSLYAIIAMCDQQLSPQAHAALYALVTFLPKPESFSQEVALVVTQQPVEILNALCDAGLLKVWGPGRYLLHRAVADYIVCTQDKASATQKQWMKGIDDSWLTNLFAKQERNGLSATEYASLIRKNEVDRKPLKCSVDEQGEFRTGRITSSSARSTDAPSSWVARILQGKSGLLGLVLLLSMILSLTICTLLPGVITKLGAHTSSTIPIREDPKPSTVVAANSDPYSPFSGKLALNDPLSDNSRGYDWQTTVFARSNDGWACQFIRGAYHAVELLNAYDSCHVASQIGNFAFEVHMQIIQGTCGGIVLRDTMSKAYAYSFKVCQNGSYQFIRHNGGGSLGPAPVLVSGSSTAITTGLNQSNVIAVVANGSTFDLYVNYHKIASGNDSSYSQGQFGVCADANTEVAYTNARAWTL